MALRLGLRLVGLSRLFQQAASMAVYGHGPYWAIDKARDVSATQSNSLHLGNLIDRPLDSWPCISDGNPGSAVPAGWPFVESRMFRTAVAIVGKENGVAESNGHNAIRTEHGREGLEAKTSDQGADLESSFGDKVRGELESSSVDLESNQDVLVETSDQHQLSNHIRKDNPCRSPKELKNPGRRLVDEGRGPESKGTREDALRAFKSLQARGPHPPIPLLDAVLRALAAVGLRAEINSLWVRYKPYAQHNFGIVPAFLSPLLSAEMYDEVVELFQDVQKERWGLRIEAADMMARAMGAQSRSWDEMWAFYKKWVEEMGMGLQRQGFRALLESGVAVEKIRSLRYKDSVRVWNRLIQALSHLNRQDEAVPIVRELVEQGVLLDSRNLIAILQTLIKSGLIKEAQELADVQAKLGMRLDGALTLAMRKMKMVKTGLEAYRSLMVIEGLHKTSLPMHAILILNCYGNLEWTEDMYQAYLLGKRFGHFESHILSLLLHQLVWSNRIFEAEQVLADYWTLRKKVPNIAPLADEVFVRLAAAYLRDSLPHKLVKMVRNMVSQRYYLRADLLRMWVHALELKDHSAHADAVRKARDAMSLNHEGWSRANRERKKQLERLEDHGGTSQKVDTADGLDRESLARRAEGNVVKVPEAPGGGGATWGGRQDKKR